jgi:pimeloyl-ACP methyl ester carboxylesterase
MLPSLPVESMTDTSDKIWMWRGFPIAYQNQGDTGPAVVLVHGFGASWRHWRKNLPVLGQICRCYAIDLIGFGGSAKPTPDQEIDYTFETWGQQIIDFCREVIGSPAFLVGNSIGCVVVMQAAIADLQWVLGVAAINCSLRSLHKQKRPHLPWYRSFGASVATKILGNKAIGSFFFQQLAKPRTVRNILRNAYHRQEAITDELIEILLKPAREEGAVDIFLAFIRYAGGPLPEELLPMLPCRAILLWGTNDPWEPIELAKEWANFPTVDRFIPLEGVGHCPQDEAPELVNPILKEWILSHDLVK